MNVDGQSLNPAIARDPVRMSRLHPELLDKATVYRKKVLAFLMASPDKDSLNEAWDADIMVLVACEQMHRAGASKAISSSFGTWR